MEVLTEEGKVDKLVASSEATLRPAQRAALKADEIADSGKAGVHAKVKNINAAKKMGGKPLNIAASRPICEGCAQAIDDAGAIAVSKLKPPKKR